ncbi:store-operated calcium entry-associated regulatory factor-like [Dysidea avara]|uniref:store-operated calcium entry-associated regulatory factor-like n=1 Tax=Dysidea avara TaxID=196820 RepID=UPI00331729E7
MERSFLLVLVVTLSLVRNGRCFGSSDKVRLTDVSTITLHSDKLTTGRRSSPVPQLQCVGGTAGCHTHKPRVVQCYNRGSDGYDVQWECKADMDKSYQFGRIQVSCEGYDYPDDPYVLKGSCGLEYEIDLTEEGRSYGGGSHDHHQQHHHRHSSRSGSSFGDMIVLLILVAIGYAIYKSCIASGRNRNTSSSSSYQSGTYPTSSSYPSGTSYSSHNANSGTGGGFWTGAATGGVLGYLFGNSRSNRGYGGGWGSGYRRSGWGSGGGGWGSTGYSSGWGSSGGRSSSSRSSSGSHTTSGFGGTSRR